MIVYLALAFVVLVLCGLILRDVLRAREAASPDRERES